MNFSEFFLVSNINTNFINTAYHYALCIVHCKMYVQYTVYTVHCTFKRCTLYSVQCALYSL